MTEPDPDYSRRLPGGLVRFEATGIHDGDEKVPQACVGQNEGHDSAGCYAEPVHCCRWRVGEKKKKKERDMLVAIARRLNIRLCRLWRESLRVS